jgi:D-alanyl-lipoteichoic acid acyltransferase DltB (MBOAT superfamily)
MFLPFVWLIHHLIGQRFRWLFLLITSYLFYASIKVPYLLGVITLVTVTTYFFGLRIQQEKSKKKKLQLLWGGIITNVLILIVMKYIPFLTDNINSLLSFFDSPISAHHAPLFVAIGVSYYIFQAISYLSDIYLEIEEPESHFGYFALYLAFFPKLLQGPIERAGDLLPQLKQKYVFNYDNLRFGILLFTWGLFKKVVLADRLGIYVDAVYDDVHSYQGLPLILATYAYAFQIYFDFSGYTDMALGTARLFNINLTNNFNSPYLATSIADFWRRWHISFSRWILDYIFKPLQIKWRNAKNWGTVAALLVTFVVSGFWHGANWGFIFWGLLHGLYLACSVFYKPYQKKIHKALHLQKTKTLKIWQIFVTFHLVTFSWVFFRMQDFSGLIYLLKNWRFSLSNLLNISYIEKAIIINHNFANFYSLSICLFFYFTCSIYSSTFNIEKNILPARWLFYYMVIFIIIIFSSTVKYGFIYYEF